MRKRMQQKTFILSALVMTMVFILCACGSFQAGAPDGFAGQWKCEELASDGETDTSFYEMTIEENGHFSMYDAAAGNPGISGEMGNDTGSTIECRFDMDDFDVPHCWTIDSSEAILDYELSDDTLRLGNNDVWMTFHPVDGEEESASGDPYAGVTTMDPAEVEAFALKVRKAYLDEDWKTISALIDYPITMDQKTKLNNAEEFQNYMDGKKLDEGSLAAMEAEDCKDMFANGQGICMADGEVWFLDVNFDGVEQTEEPLLKIIAVQGLQ